MTGSLGKSLGNSVFGNKHADRLSGNAKAPAASMPVARAAGGDWSIVASPNTRTDRNNYLTGVTCASASDCWAAGYYVTTNLLYQTLIEHWDGTSWAIVTSPNTSTTHSNLLTGVTCVSASDCWAVGYFYSDSVMLLQPVNQTLIEHWNGPRGPSSPP